MIIEFKNEYDFLSNFYHSPMMFNTKFGKMRFPTAEHMYMSFKNDTAEWVNKCASDEFSPAQIKKMSRKVKLIDDWDNLRNIYMKITLTTKFNNPELAKRLVATGDQNIQEGNYWGDTYWGVDLRVSPNIGENHLGRLLMSVRSELIRKSQKTLF